MDKFDDSKLGLHIPDRCRLCPIAITQKSEYSDAYERWLDARSLVESPGYKNITLSTLHDKFPGAPEDMLVQLADVQISSALAQIDSEERDLIIKRSEVQADLNLLTDRCDGVRRVVDSPVLGRTAFITYCLSPEIPEHVIQPVDIKHITDEEIK